MATITALPVNSQPPYDFWRRTSTTVNQMLGEIADLYRRPTQEITSNYTVAESDYGIVVDATNGAVNITLPAPAKGRELIAKKVDSSANAVTLTGTIEGATSKTLASQWAGIRLYGNGDQWLVV